MPVRPLHLILITASVAFTGLGIVMSCLGPTLPEIAAHLRTNVATVGTLYTALFAGGLAAQGLMTLVSAEWRRRRAPVVTFALFACGFVVISMTGSMTTLLIVGVLTGVGYGGLVATTNLLVAEATGARQTSALNLVNCFFGAGAVVGPFCAAEAIRRWGTSLPTLWAGAAVVALAIPLALRIPRGAIVPVHARAAVADKRPTRLPFVLCGLMMLYVGIEIGTSAWLSVYLQRAQGISAARGAAVTAVFWLGLTGGRLLASRAAPERPPEGLLRICVAVAFLMAAMLAAVEPAGPALFATVLVLGGALGPMFPTLLGATTTRYRDAPVRPLAMVLAAGSVGGAIIPAAQGIALGYFGPLAPVWMAMIALAGMAALTYNEVQTRCKRGADEVQTRCKPGVGG